MNLLYQLPLLIGSPEGGAGGGAGPTQIAPTLVTFGLVFAIFYFLIIRPQNKRQKDTKSMLAALKKGDKIATIGGIRGTVASLKDDTVLVKVDDDTKILFSRSAIGQVLNSAGGKAKADKSAETEPEETTTDGDAE